jgi:hypothetical protein
VLIRPINEKLNIWKPTRNLPDLRQMLSGVLGR